MYLAPLSVGHGHLAHAHWVDPTKLCVLLDGLDTPVFKISLVVKTAPGNYYIAVVENYESIFRMSGGNDSDAHFA